MSVLRRLALLLLVGWLWPAGCAPEDVVVVELPPAPVGPAAGGCQSNADCPPSGFCARSSCDEASGSCVARPLSCPADEGPVCGCDGISYWNDCLRQLFGVSSSSSGQCVINAVTCGGPQSVACTMEGASCGRLAPPGLPCSMKIPGICWILPPTCPDSVGGARWVTCPPPPGCSNVCEAIRSEVPHALMPGPPCP